MLEYAPGKEICVLYGLSGSGKTQAAIDYVHRALQRFGNYLWIAGSDWAEGVSLTAIKRSRGGVAINVAGVFNATKTLLVVDDLQRPVTAEVFEELRQGFGLGGRVLVTSQMGDPTSWIHLALPRMSTATAFSILNEDEATASDGCKQFVESCRFCPLILAVTREVIRIDDTPRDEIYGDVLQDPNSVQQDDGQAVMQRVLRRLSEPTRRALSKIADSGCSTYDSRFLSHFIRPQPRVALQKLAILNRTAATDLLSVHDLICRAMRSEKPVAHEFVSAIAGYVERSRGEMTPSVLRQIHLSSAQLKAAHEAGYEAENPSWFTYALLQTEKSALKPLIANLKAIPLRADMPIAELLCVVDAREAASYELGDDDRKAYYRACATDYAAVLVDAKEPEFRAEMLHHQGKSLRRCGDIDGALVCFQQLLMEQPDWHATYGQIAHLGTQTGVSLAVQAEGEKAMQRLVDDILKSVYSVPLRVSLAALSRLRSYKNVNQAIGGDEVKIKHFGDVVALSALEGFDQFYEGFLAFTSLFGYRHGSACLAIADVFPDMLAIFPNAVAKRQWQNTCEALSNLSTVAVDEGNTELAAKLAGPVAAFAEALAIERTDPFATRVVAKALLAAGDPKRALDAANRIDDQAKDHWLLYQQAKAELALGQSASALLSAKRAFDGAERDPKVGSRITIYHDLLSQALEATGDVKEALNSAQTALAQVSDDKYKTRLTQRVKVLSARLM